MSAAAVGLCADSSAQLSIELADSVGALVVPVPVSVDGDSFEEGVDLDPDWFYERLAAGAHATTSQPNPARFLRAYEDAAAAGARRILSLHLSGSASGTVQAARTAAEAAPVPVTVVDSGTTSFGVGLCVLEAARALARGAPVGQAAAGAVRLGARLGNVFVAAGAPGGRVPAAPERPVFSFADGSATRLAAAARDDDAVAVMAEHIAAREGPLGVAIGHAAAETEAWADLLAEQLAQAKIAELLRYRVGPSVGAHTGPWSYGAFWWRRDQPARG
ncbi:MAG: DegV family protein [Gaiellaceae bacterium]